MRRYSRPRHLSAGCTSPRAPVGTKAARLDHHALAAGRGQRLPPGDGGGAAVGVVEVNRTPGRRRERRAGRGHAGERLHVPDVVPVDMGAALGGQQVERRQPEVVHRADRPAVAAVGVGEGPRRRRPRSRSVGQRRDVHAAGRRPGEQRLGLREAGAGRGADRRVLAGEQRLRLGGPRHQLGVQADPVGLEPVPEPGRPSAARTRSSSASWRAASAKKRRPVRV